MAIKVSYLSREVGINLKRNITLTIATIATVAVSLTLVGTAYLIGRGVEGAQQQFEGGVEFIVFMNPNATDAQIDAVRTELEDNPQIRSADFCDQQCAYEEFQDLFADDPQLIENVEPEILPPSFKVKPVDAETDSVEALGAVFRPSPACVKSPSPARRSSRSRTSSASCRRARPWRPSCWSSPPRCWS